MYGCNRRDWNEFSLRKYFAYWLAILIDRTATQPNRLNQAIFFHFRLLTRFCVAVRSSKICKQRKGMNKRKQNTNKYWNIIDLMPTEMSVHTNVNMANTSDRVRECMRCIFTNLLEHFFFYFQRYSGNGSKKCATCTMHVSTHEMVRLGLRIIPPFFLHRVSLYRIHFLPLSISMRANPEQTSNYFHWFFRLFFKCFLCAPKFVFFRFFIFSSI